MTTALSYLILCDDRDRVGPRALTALRAGVVHRVELCTSSDLERAAYVQVARKTRKTSGEIVLRDGRIFTVENTIGLWNRLSHWPSMLAGRNTGASAALCTWMRGIAGPLVGTPSLFAPQRSHSWSRLHWANAAYRAGFCTAVVRRQVGSQVNSLASALEPGERLSVLVAGERLLCAGHGGSDLPQSTRDACLRLGHELGSGLLEISLKPSGERDWAFDQATQLPDPFNHGTDGIAALIDLWKPRSAVDNAGLELEEAR